MALSSYCRDLLPLHRLVHEVASACLIKAKDPFEIKSTIWEDNQGALCLANMKLPQMTPGSRHWATKYHRFHSLVQNSTQDGIFIVKAIDTKNQLADIFTKLPDSTTFISNVNSWLGNIQTNNMSLLLV